MSAFDGVAAASSSGGVSTVLSLLCSCIRYVNTSLLNADDEQALQRDIIQRTAATLERRGVTATAAALPYAPPSQPVAQHKRRTRNTRGTNRE
jgi:hypothetical protein